MLHSSAGKMAAAAAKSLQSCPTLCDPIDGSPRGSHPWDSPGKNNGVGCHFLLQCMKVKSESEVAQSCSTLSDPMDLLQSTRLLCPWDFPGKSTGVGYQCLLWEKWQSQNLIKSSILISAKRAKFLTAAIQMSQL